MAMPHLSFLLILFNSPFHVFHLSNCFLSRMAILGVCMCVHIFYFTLNSNSLPHVPFKIMNIKS